MEEKRYISHARSMVDEGSQVGAGTRVWAGAHIMAGATVGAGCNIGENCFLEGGVQVGNGVTIKNNVALYSGAVIEDDVFLGPSCVFTNVTTPRAFISRKSEFRSTRVCKGASIGANATILCGNTIGRYAMVGAGSVVTHDVPEYALVFGTPARVQGYVCRCGERLALLDKRGSCPACQRTYHLADDGALVEDDLEEKEG